MKSGKAVNSPQVNKERTFHAHMLVCGKLMHLAQKYILQLLNFRLVLNLFLIFHQISRSCSHKIVLLKQERVAS